ncbi:hypothetical protein BGZ79_004787 [Entomortierella chlamydospora]|nr:hypothetical protein BGZ79_004787 [Entomortierella chlamydospora]
MAYATVGNNLYVQGGALDTSLKSVNQLSSLDITQTWNVSTPPWKSLNVGSGSELAPSDVAHSMIVSKDQQSLILLGTATLDSTLNISTYNIAGNSWSEPGSVPLPNVTQDLSGLAAAADPNTGLIYIPGGGNEGQNMMEYNPSTGASQLLPMPAEYTGKSVRYFTTVWSTQRNSVLLYGGFYNSLGVDVAIANVYEYPPSTASWSLISLVWSQGTDIDQSLARSRMACATSGDSFVAWGGFGTSAALLGTPVVYDLKANKWVTEFTTVSTLPASPASSSGHSSDSRGSSTAAIGGSFIITIAAIVIATFL